jgi:processive 1,2-diacylglycerol beta-glucosyltransferase
MMSPPQHASPLPTRNGWHRDAGQDLLPTAQLPRPPWSRPPRILILSVAVGSGHMRAAQALELAFRRLCPEADITNLEVLRLASGSFRRCYGQMYLDFINLAPQVLGFFYNMMDQVKPPLCTPWDRLRVSLEAMSMRPFVQLVRSEAWDLIVNTHFLPAEVISLLHQQGRLTARQVMVTTDYETHRLWVTPPCEHYFAATNESARYLECFGVPRDIISTTGIPIHPSFAEPKDRAACLARHGLRGDRPVLLQLAGGGGVGPIEQLYRAVLDVRHPLDIVMVTGHNAEARRHVQQLPVPERHRVQILGFTNQIDELMAVADLVMTKPGGLTTAETLASGAGMVVVTPVPGQEERNSDYLLENGAAIKINHLETLASKTDALLDDPGQLSRLKASARRIGRPRAAFDVVEQCLALLPEARGQRPEVRGQESEVRGQRSDVEGQESPVNGAAHACAGDGAAAR